MRRLLTACLLLGSLLHPAAANPYREPSNAVRAALDAPLPVRPLASPDGRWLALLEPARVVIEGSVGYYCGGMMDGARIEVHGSAGWGAAESMMSGTLIIDGSAGNGAAASIRGGTVVVRGDAAARAGVALKGGTLLVGGSAGYMAGFMMQKGRLVICGDTGDALADSMYEGVVFVGGKIASLGNDAVIEEPSARGYAWIGSTAPFSAQLVALVSAHMKPSRSFQPRLSPACTMSISSQRSWPTSATIKRPFGSKL